MGLSFALLRVERRSHLSVATSLPCGQKWRREWDYPSLLSGSLRFAPSRTAFPSFRRYITALRSEMAEGVGLSFAALRLSPLCSESNGVLILPSLHHCPAVRNGGGSGIRTHGRLPYTRFRIERLKPDSAIPPLVNYSPCRFTSRMPVRHWHRLPC